MPLQPPILDDRSFADLREELIARIPVFTPEWTDHNPSDPGITLLELFAFLGEQLLFRFNQIPDTTKLAFLDLLDIELRPAVPAKGIVEFSTDLPAGVVVEQGSRLLAGEVRFQTRSEVRAWPIEARGAIKQRFDDHEIAGLDDTTREYLSRAAAAAAGPADVVAYRTRFGAHDPAGTRTDSLAPAGAVDKTLYVAMLGDPSADLTGMASGLLTIGIVPAADVGSMDSRAPCPGEGFERSTPAFEWQISTIEARDDSDPVWRTLEVVGDTTGGLSFPGSVRLELPDDLSTIGVWIPDDPDAVGSGDQPPLVDDDEIARQLLFWLRVFRPDSSDLPPIDWVGTNAVLAEQTINAGAELLGIGAGVSGQELRLVNRNIVGDVELDVDEAGTGRWVRWDRVDDLRGSGINDRHFVLDREAGIVKCGDGRRGRIWQIGEQVRVQPYRHGGGSAGNVATGAVAAIPGVPRVRVTNPLPMRGGVDAESLPDAMDRIPEEFRRRDRAVTVGDFRELAESTPGAGVGRAETLRLFHPKTPTEKVPGAVSVVVWPRSDAKHPNAPVPDRTTLDAVCAYLDRRRLVTTEVHVIPPTYRKIAVSIGIEMKPGFGIEAARRWSEMIVRQYLAPLPPYGPEGRGWPLGRSVYGPELEAAVLQVEGVEYVEDLRIGELDENGVWIEPGSRRVSLEAWEVVELAAITVVSGQPNEPGVSLDPADTSGTPVPVRQPRTVC